MRYQKNKSLTEMIDYIGIWYSLVAPKKLEKNAQMILFSICFRWKLLLDTKDKAAVIFRAFNWDIPLPLDVH